MKIFDYLFFRVAKAYYKWDKSEANTAVIAISFTQFLILFTIPVAVSRCFYTRTELAPNAKHYAYVGAGILVILILVNSYRYNNKYNFYLKRWSDQSKNIKFLGGVFTLAMLLVPLIMALALAIF
jgi:hypothetical protein